MNHAERFVVFGAWDIHTAGRHCLILSGQWQAKSTGRRNPGYAQSREHIRLIVEDGYSLKTFPMKWGGESDDDSGDGPAKIEDFTPILSSRGLLQLGDDWYATDSTQGDLDTGLAEELGAPERYPEGARKQIVVNAVERSAKARTACIRHHGLDCVVCGFNFERVYGALGEDFIHVHHLVPVTSLRVERQVDPVADLVPVCPNCHAMIHQVTPPLEIARLQELIRERSGADSPPTCPSRPGAAP